MAQSNPLPTAQLLVPRQSLASCARAYVTRSTMESPLADPAERLNRFPASPFCSITWFIEGEVEMIDPPAPDNAVWNRIVFVGPQTRPMLTYNPGPVRAFMVLFYPQALHAMCGLDLSGWVDKWAPLHESLGPAWIAMADAVLKAPDDDARVAALEGFLDPLWQDARSTEMGSAVGDWVRHLGTQAAATGWGRGVRNVERRIKAWAGQPMRTLRRMRRAEQSFLDTREELRDNKVSWAEVAARGGYADQAHFCRETREITGLSPVELMRAGRDDESYWIYRIWA